MKLKMVFFTILIASGSIYGQDFTAEAKLQSVETDGFYRIDISPALSAYTNAGFSNIRIYTQQKTEVPYLFQQEALQYYSAEFKPYEIVEKKQVRKCCTEIILKNPDSLPINNISLSIKNAEVSKQATLLGSDDQENWFALKQQFTLHTINNPDNTTVVKIVDFPLSNYTFYKLEIDDSSSAPLNILSAGYYEQQSEEAKFTAIPNLRIEATDSVLRKQTFIKISLDTTRTIDRIKIEMTGQPYFVRRGSLYSLQYSKNRKGEPESFLQWEYDLELSSKQITILNVNELRSSELMIIIDNQDNPPLQLESAQLLQRSRYLVAWLKKGEDYVLKMGVASMKSPSYDLANFQGEIPKQLAQINLGEFKVFNKEGAQTSTTIFTNRMIIWVAIILVVALLGFMSVKLIRETHSGKTEH
ncbi:DUF3999 domain-containing protein [Chryseotalea sanaruensis]|uniref:DUF3999 domain-containing protein n=1 Tax=Chryseotalea sanaruensis TaxID=2482724 RepID=A0A401U822_9BACT|nr:hypothetical protein [Chryseotalea sanaruensis]GCC51043.1 DUF3999 domain-containing protein [Chryseotalea sanaruensis]